MNTFLFRMGLAARTVNKNPSVFVKKCDYTHKAAMLLYVVFHLMLQKLNISSQLCLNNVREGGEEQGWRNEHEDKR